MFAVIILSLIFNNVTFIVPSNIQPASGLISQIAVKNDNYVIEFNITEAHPKVENGSIKWWYQEDLSSALYPWPPMDVKGQKQPPDRHSLSDDRRSLNISNIQISDGGLYTLMATNAAGIRNKTVSLTIHGKTLLVTTQDTILTICMSSLFAVAPHLHNSKGTNLTRKENEQAVFNCSASGIPAPNIIWYRGGQLLFEVQNKFSISTMRFNNFHSQDMLHGLEGTISVLTVLSLTSTDSSTYFCRADNGVEPGVAMQIPYNLEVVSKCNIHDECF